MNILVLMKPVPDPEKYNEIKIDPATGCVVREGVPTVINPADRNALEAAITLRDKSPEGGSITVLAMAPEFCRDKVVESLAMGADEGYLVSDRAFAGADTYATSYVLSEAIGRIAREKGMDFDLVLAGNESADGATSHVPSQVAEWLGITHICNVCSIELPEGEDEGTIQVVKRSEEVLLTFRGTGPAVIAVTRDINKPRLISAMGIIKARKKPVTIWTNAELDLEESRTGLEGSPTRPGKLITPDLGREGKPLVPDDDGNEKIDATPAEAAKAIEQIIRKAKS